MSLTDDPVELLDCIINGGRRVFEPEDDSMEALGAFQPIVESIYRLSDDGHLEINEPERDESSRMRYYTRLEVVTVRPSARKVLERASGVAGPVTEVVEEIPAEPVAPPAEPEVTPPTAIEPQPGVGVGAVVVHEGCVLLVRRAHPPRAGQWTVPGGKVAFGESLQEAAEREVREETGVSVAAGAPLHTFELMENGTDGQPAWHYVIVDLRAESLAGEPVAATDAAEAAWFNAEQLGRLKLDGETRRLLRRIPELGF